MSANNLRVIYQNLADLSTTIITTPNTANTSTAELANSTISGNTLIVGSITSGSILVGMYLSGGVIPTNTYIVSGSGLSWTLNRSTVQASTTITATETNVHVSNLTKDTKSLIWKSLIPLGIITVNFGSPKTVSGVILPFTNFTSTAKMNVTCTGGGSTTSTGDVLACPYYTVDTWDSSYLPKGSSSYAYGGGTYARVWFNTPQVCTGLTIQITDPSLGYLEASRLIIGDHWSPVHNTSFGLTSAPKSLSANSRTESGDLVTNRGIQYNTMNFDLAWLTPSDRTIFTKILKSNGINKGMFISLFPNNGTSTVDAAIDYDKEQTFQIYGKLSSLVDINHPMYTMYSTKIDIEEI